MASNTMQQILLVSGDAGQQALLEKAIDKQHCHINALVRDVSELAAEVEKHAVDLVVMAIDKETEADIEQIRWVMDNKPRPIVMFVAQGDRESAASVLRRSKLNANMKG